MKSRFSSPYLGHHKVWLLLPWYVNDSLEETELVLVQQHLKVCIACRKELAIQQRTARAIRDASIVALSQQIAFSQLRGRIASEGQTPVLLTHWRHRCQGMWSPGVAGLLRAPVFWRVAIALSAFLVIGITPPVRQWLTPVNDEPAYHTLAGSAGLSEARENQIYVVFADAVGPAQIARLLRAIDAKIVDGPSSLGVYTLGVVVNGSDRDVLDVAAQLRRNPRVQFAEPALSTAAVNSGSND